MVFAHGVEQGQAEEKPGEERAGADDGGHPADRHQNQRDVAALQVGKPSVVREEPGQHGQEGADEEGPEQSSVGHIRPVEERDVVVDQRPAQFGVVEDRPVVVVADASAAKQVTHDDGEGRGEERSQTLRFEQRPRTHLDVMGQFHVFDQHQRLDEDDVADGDEGVDLLGRFLQGERLTDDQTEVVDGQVVQQLPGDRRDQAEGQGEDRPDEQGEQNVVPAQPLGVVAGDTADDQGDEEDLEVTPVGHRRVDGDQARVQVVAHVRQGFLRQLVPDVFAVVENGVHEHAGDAGKRGEGGDQTDRREVRGDVASDRQPTEISQVQRVDDGNDQPDDQNEAEGDVDQRPRRQNQRRAEILGDLVPVQRQAAETHSQASHGGQLGQGVVVRVDPAHPGEVAEDGHDVQGKPLVDEGDGEDEEEEAQPMVDDGASEEGFLRISRFGDVLLVKRAQNGDERQILWPDHFARPDEKATEDSGQAEAQELNGENEEEVVGEVQFVTFENFQRRQRGIDEDGMVHVGDVGHDQNDGVLFHGELARGRIDPLPE